MRKGPDPNDESFETTKEVEIVDESELDESELDEYELDEQELDEEVLFHEDNMDNYDINELKNPDDYVKDNENQDDKFKESQPYEDIKHFFQGMENRIESNLSTAITHSFNHSISQLRNMLITAINSNKRANSNDNHKVEASKSMKNYSKAMSKGMQSSNTFSSIVNDSDLSCLRGEWTNLFRNFWGEKNFAAQSKLLHIKMV